MIMETKRRFNTNRYYQVRANLDEQHLSILNKLGLIDDDNRLIYGIKRGMVRKMLQKSYLREFFCPWFDQQPRILSPGMVFPTTTWRFVRRLAESQGVVSG